MMEKNINRLLSIGSLLLVILVIVFASTLWTTRARYSVLFLMLCMIICILRFVTKSRQSYLSGLLTVIILFLSIGSSAYFYHQYVPMLYRAGANDLSDYVFGIILLVPVAFLTWKEGGKAITFLVLAFLLYAHFGKVFPGLLFHNGLSLQRILEVEVLNYEGIYGFVIQVVATWVTIFIIYAGLLQGFGALEIITKIFVRFGKRYKYGLPEIPVFVSMIFGSFSGAAAANVAGTGSFTIPLLKKFGFRPRFAGAIESVASSGGQLMPPIMGATAFLMSDLLGEPLLKIMIIGFIPAGLLYLDIAYAVYLNSQQYMVSFSPEDLVGGKEEELSKSEIAGLIPMVISLTVLFCLLFFKIPVMRSALFGIVTFLIVQLVYEMRTPSRRVLVDFLWKIADGCKKGAIPAASIGVVAGAMGLIIKTLTVTALAPKLAFLMVDLAEGMLPVLVLLVLVVCLLFGSALATLAVYILVVFIAAPAFSEMGVPPLVSHFMIFYFGSLAMITPPVAPAVLVASGIAGSDYMETCWESLKLGSPLLFIPISFINYPELLIWDYRTPHAVLIVALGLLFLSYGIYKRETRRAFLIKRSVCILGGFFILVAPMRTLDICVAVGIILMFAFERLLRKRGLNAAKR